MSIGHEILDQLKEQYIGKRVARLGLSMYTYEVIDVALNDVGIVFYIKWPSGEVSCCCPFDLCLEN